jgi:uncharacterized integral membrane protein (TIGR00698 family)
VIPGTLVAVAVALLALLCARFAPLVGGPVFAIVIGVAIRSLRPLPASWKPGLAFSARTVLQAAIVVSGFGLSFAMVIGTGVATLPVTLGTIAVALVLAPPLGRLLRVEPMQRMLIGVGTAICGASAIAAVSSVTDAGEADVALSIATVFFYNVVAVLIFPPIGHALHLGQSAFGVWAGTAINDTSSVVAAGFAYGREAGQHATIVKLTRATMILPIVAAIALRRARARRAAGTPVPWRRIVPWFIVWFLCAALANGAGLVPRAWHDAIAFAAIALISVALAAIGLQTELARLLRSGPRPLALGFLLWIAVALSSLAIQHAAGI